MGEHQRVVVDVGDLAGGADLLRGLVGPGGGGASRADVQGMAGSPGWRHSRLAFPSGDGSGLLWRSGLRLERAGLYRQDSASATDAFTTPQIRLGRLESCRKRPRSGVRQWDLKQ